ncbi:MAG TPA: zinc-dependent metalloprotease [Blastocatellia bacterium]|nr:zinc-dependent metalloprotease [Blastocatellia bacterium]
MTKAASKFCAIFFATLLAPALGAIGSITLAQEPPGGTAAGGQERPSLPFPSSREPEIRPYDRVITKDAKSDEGIFTVHRIKEKIYYEIPKKEFDKEFLWVSQIAKTTLGVGYGGQAMGNRVVRWERHNNRILLRNISYAVVADEKEPISKAVKDSNNDSIIRAFYIEALDKNGKDDSVVIDVTSLFTTEINEFSARTRLRARMFDASRSFVERVVSFPENIEVEATHTFTNPPDLPSPTAAPAPPNPFLGAGMGTGSASVVMHYSMVKLPEKPMMPRLFDERVGYFSVRKMDYGKNEHRAPERIYVTRWRLEKKDPNASLSEPIKPIVYYVDPATPTKWVSYIKKGIEDWQPAFEAAGFKNAILAREAPKDDPEWSPEDARYSVVRWLPSTIQNASGPHIHDPRTGEILESDIQMYHNILSLQRNWYFTQAGPLDPRAKKLPLPDDLMGELLRFVVAHEVGHTLGFQHNMKASSMYPFEKIRDAKWLKENGHTPTIMDYSRFNYVAQPEDNIPVELLIPKIGPYDKWATMWGYKPIDGCKSPEDEKLTLDEWARQQDKTPWFRFSTARSRGADPGELTEAVGDADAVKASTLGLKNLKRVADMLLTACTTEKGDPYDDLEEVYNSMIGQWRLEMGHVTAIVGGFNTQQKHVGQEGVLFTPIPKERQIDAVKFLNENVFATPTWMLNPEILRRIETNGSLSRVRAAQQSLMMQLMSPARFTRLIEQEAMDGDNAYRPVDFMADVRKGVWGEVNGAMAASPKVDAYRRNLQRAYLDMMNDKLNGRFAVNDDQRPFIRGELRTLSADVTRALTRTTDRATRMHLDDVKDQIAKILDPKFAAPAPTSSPIPFIFGLLNPDGEELRDEVSCWPDYSLRIRQ